MVASTLTSAMSSGFVLGKSFHAQTAPSVNQAIADMFGRGIFIEQVQADSMNGAKCLKERRIDQKAIPDDIRSRLTGAQLVTLGRLKGFGWSLKFVRKPLYQDQIVVLVDPSGKQHAVLHKDGSLDTKPDFMIR